MTRYLSCLSGLLVLLSVVPAYADRLDEVQKRKTLIWGADEEGGAPYLSKDKDDPNKLVGFEVELAAMIAGELKVKPEFKQGQWEDVPSLLDKGDIDIALNGYELTKDNRANYACSRPYYVYGLQLIVRNDSPLESWDDILDSKDKIFQIGVLRNSAAHKYLSSEKFANKIAAIGYGDNTDCYRGLRSGKLDGTLQDDCLARYQADDYRDMRFVETPVAPGFYTVLIRQGEDRLLAEVNRAIAKLIDDGRLKELYDRWDLGGRAQMLGLRNLKDLPPVEKTNPWDVVRSSFTLLLEGAVVTILLSFASMPLAIGIGILVAIGRLYGPSWLRWPLAAYVEVLRGTPLLLQLFFIFFLLPEIGISLSAPISAVLGLAINYSAYEAEIYRAGLQAIPVGQMEAALSLGMSRAQAIRKVILPQAVRIVIPPVTNDFIALFKDTSVCSIVTLVELTKQYQILGRNNPNSIVHLAAVTAVLYLLMSYPLSLFARYSERRLSGRKPGIH